MPRTMRGLGWTEAELNSRLKNDSGKLAMAARVRKETTLPIKWIAARLHSGHLRKPQTYPASLATRP